MNEQQQVAFVQSQVACAMIKALGMHAANMQRQAEGRHMQYFYWDFDALIKEYDIDYKTVIGRMG